MLVVATTAAGSYLVQAALDGTSIATPQEVTVAPGPAQLNRCVVIVEALEADDADASTGAVLTAGELASVTLNASDQFGNVFALNSLLQVRCLQQA